MSEISPRQREFFYRFIYTLVPENTSRHFQTVTVLYRVSEWHGVPSDYTRANRLASLDGFGWQALNKNVDFFILLICPSGTSTGIKLIMRAKRS